MTTTSKRPRDQKLVVRLSGYPRYFILWLADELFDGSLSRAISFCIEFCMDYDENMREGGERPIIDQVWFEAPRRFRKHEDDLMWDRKGDRTEFTAYVDVYALDYIKQFTDKYEYPMFRGSRTNVVTACVYTTMLMLLEGKIDGYRVEIKKEGK